MCNNHCRLAIPHYTSTTRCCGVCSNYLVCSALMNYCNWTEPYLHDGNGTLCLNTCRLPSNVRWHESRMSGAGMTKVFTRWDCCRNLKIGRASCRERAEVCVG